MNLFLLPGNSPDNREWIDSLKAIFSDLFKSCIVQYYDHWENLSQSMNPRIELEKLSKSVKDEDNYALFAKSAGVSLSVKALESGLIKPKFCIFVGTASIWTSGSSIDLEKLKSNLNIPVLFIQQTSDKYVHFSELKKMLDKLALLNYKLVEVEGGDHKYADVEKILKEVRSFMSKQNLL